MTILYCETDPIGPNRWTGVNRLLTAYEVDYNFYQHETRIATLESNAHTTVSIAYITMHGDQMTIHMTDHSTQGPFTVPVAVFRDRGTWTAITPYSVNDLVSYNGALYLVIFNHTSQATFSPTANDGLGHDYYALLLSLPGSSLPTGGATGQVLSKSSSSDYAVTWSYKLPAGGTTGQFLKKNSNVNQDVSWGDLGSVAAPPASPAGIAGYVLATRDGSDANTEWVSVVYAPPPSPSGSANQGLVTSTGFAQDMEWKTLIFAPPPSPAGAAGMFLKTVDGTPENTAWSTLAANDVVEFVIDGGGSTITTGMKGYIKVPFNCTITQADLLADQSGSIVIDVWKTTYANFDAGVTHPKVGDSITASSPPTIAGSTKSTNTTLTSWTISINAGDILAFNVNSVTTLQRVTIALTVSK